MLTLPRDEIMFETFYDDPQTFVSDLNKLEIENYQFRGVEKRIWVAQPRLFRSHEVIINRAQFPTPYEIIKSQWYNHPSVIKCIQDNFKIPMYAIKYHLAIR